MVKTDQPISQLPMVVFKRQAYLNLIYLAASFPLGVFYFVFLVSGLSLGISLSIIWVGIPVLLLVGIGLWFMAKFERYTAIQILNEDIPEMIQPAKENADVWNRFKVYLLNPVTWKSMLYLLLKFPLGLATFIILITFASLTFAFISIPFTYQSVPPFQDGVSIGLGLSSWHIDSLGDALICVLIGLILWPATLHIANGLAWVHAKFARLMLSLNPWKNSSL